MAKETKGTRGNMGSGRTESKGLRPQRAAVAPMPAEQRRSQTLRQMEQWRTFGSATPEELVEEEKAALLWAA